jgi:hypothetical protein
MPYAMDPRERDAKRLKEKKDHQYVATGWGAYSTVLKSVSLSCKDA